MEPNAALVVVASWLPLGLDCRETPLLGSWLEVASDILKLHHRSRCCNEIGKVFCLRKVTGPAGRAGSQSRRSRRSRRSRTRSHNPGVQTPKLQTSNSIRGISRAWSIQIQIQIQIKKKTHSIDYFVIININFVVVDYYYYCSVNYDTLIPLTIILPRLFPHPSSSPLTARTFAANTPPHHALSL